MHRKKDTHGDSVISIREPQSQYELIFGQDEIIFEKHELILGKDEITLPTK